MGGGVQVLESTSRQWNPDISSIWNPMSEFRDLVHGILDPSSGTQVPYSGMWIPVNNVQNSGSGTKKPCILEVESRIQGAILRIQAPNVEFRERNVAQNQKSVFWNPSSTGM